MPWPLATLAARLTCLLPLPARRIWPLRTANRVRRPNPKNPPKPTPAGRQPPMGVAGRRACVPPQDRSRRTRIYSGAGNLDWFGPAAAAPSRPLANGGAP